MPQRNEAEQSARSRTRPATLRFPVGFTSEGLEEGNEHRWRSESLLQRRLQPAARRVCRPRALDAIISAKPEIDALSGETVDDVIMRGGSGLTAG